MANVVNLRRLPFCRRLPNDGKMANNGKMAKRRKFTTFAILPLFAIHGTGLCGKYVDETLFAILPLFAKFWQTTAKWQTS